MPGTPQRSVPLGCCYHNKTQHLVSKALGKRNSSPVASREPRSRRVNLEAKKRLSVKKETLGERAPAQAPGFPGRSAIATHLSSVCERTFLLHLASFPGLREVSTGLKEGLAAASGPGRSY